MRSKTHGETHSNARGETRGAVWLYGVHAAAAALANPRREILRLVVLREGVLPRLIAAGAPPARIAAAEEAAREAITDLLPPGAVHQGVALLARPLAQPPLDAVLDANPARLVVLDQVTDPQNAGAILRSCAAFGAAALIMQARHAPPISGALAKAAAGGLDSVPLVHVTNISRALARLTEAGITVLGLDASAQESLAGRRARGLTGPPAALVLGAEGTGLRPLVARHCDCLVRIPLGHGANGAPPAITSLNVAATAAVALYALVEEGAGS